MKICYDYQIFYDQEYGGVSRYYIELIQCLKQYQECSIDIPVLFSQNEYLRQCMGVKKIANKKFFINRITRGLNIIYSQMQINKNQYDLIHPTWLHPYVFSRKDNVKIVVTIHDMIHEIIGEKIYSTAIKRKKECIYRSDAIITISHNTKQDILKMYPDIPEDKITVVYHGTNHLPKPVKPKKFDVPEKYILFVGKREGYKQGLFLAEVMAEELNAKKSLFLVYIGGGAFNEHEKQILHELNIDEYVIQKNVNDAELAFMYANAVCFVYPTMYEGFGFPILEAFDNGCPVVCTNSSSLPEVGGEAALYFEFKDKNGLKEQINKLLYDEAIRVNHIQRGKERVKEFDWKETARKTYEVYKKMVIN